MTINNNDKQSSLTPDEKNMLWSKIEEHTFKEKLQRKQAPLQIKKLSFFSFISHKVAIASFLIIALLGTGVATVSASDDAVPGDILFPVDLAVEKIKLAFSRGNKKDTLRIAFAEERLHEVKFVLETNIT